MLVNPLPVKMNDIFVKHDALQNDTYQWSSGIVFTLKTSLVSLLMEGAWIVLAASTSNLLWYHTLYSSWKTLLYTCESMSVKQVTKVLVWI